ncbi:Carboxypeptidase B [Paramyrothecium foliicola]|nr:Carboxypeptidase B [Paramyrothecium foliicola]
MKLTTIATALGLTSSVTACLLDREIEAEREYLRTGKRSDVHAPPSARQVSTTFPIGTGDRFAKGCKVPVGLGTDDRDLGSILSVEEVTSALKGLKRGFPDEVELFEPPFETYEGRSFPALVIGENPRVFLMSGIHARERGGPDNVIYFLADLLAARKAGTGVTYGGKTYTNAQVELALSAGVVAIPLTNPDGVAHDQATNTCWRKNRNPESAVGATNGRDIGIDLNRNYDFIWDYKKHFHPDTSPASNDPRSETFYGTEPASEAETKAVVWTLDNYQNITWFMDLHSYGPSILYAWGDDEVTTELPEQNFVNPAFDGKRGLVGGEDPPDAEYKEFFLPNDLKIEEDVMDSMIDSMLTVGGAPYTAYPAVGLYPTSGASNDYAMGRFYGNLTCGASRMFGLTMEFGAPSRSFPSCPFYPNASEYHRNVRQVGAGFLEMMLQAAGKAGDPLFNDC